MNALKAWLDLSVVTSRSFLQNGMSPKSQLFLIFSKNLIFSSLPGLGQCQPECAPDPGRSITGQPMGDQHLRTLFSYARL